MVENNTFNKIVVSKHSRNGRVNEAKLSHNQLRSHVVAVANVIDMLKEDQ